MDAHMRYFDALNTSGQEVTDLLDECHPMSSVVRDILQHLQQRWDKLVEGMERKSRDVRLTHF